MQPASHAWGNRLARFLPAAGLETLEMLGFISDTETIGGQYETGEVANSFNNTLSQWAAEKQEQLEEWRPVYKTPEDSGVWNPGSSKWWAENVFNMAESVTGFMAAGAVTGGVLSAIGAGAGALGAAAAGFPRRPLPLFHHMENRQLPGQQNYR